MSHAGLYELAFGSKLPAAKKFCDWVFSQVLPSIRKYGQYKLFDNPNNHMFKTENETDLHYKVVQYIRHFYPEAIIVPGLGELQDTPNKRIDAWKKGYLKGQGDLLILKNLTRITTVSSSSSRTLIIITKCRKPKRWWGCVSIKKMMVSLLSPMIMTASHAKLLITRKAHDYLARIA